MAVVIVVVPITIRVPAVAVFVPPPMVLVPATFACFAQFMAGMVGLSAVPAMMLDGLVQFVIGLVNAPLTTAVVISIGARRGRESEQANQRCGGEHRTSQKLLRSRVLGHGFSILPYFPR